MNDACSGGPELSEGSPGRFRAPLRMSAAQGRAWTSRKTKRRRASPRFARGSDGGPAGPELLHHLAACLLVEVLANRGEDGRFLRDQMGLEVELESGRDMGQISFQRVVTCRYSLERQEDVEHAREVGDVLSVLAVHPLEGRVESRVDATEAREDGVLLVLHVERQGFGEVAMHLGRGSAELVFSRRVRLGDPSRHGGEASDPSVARLEDVDDVFHRLLGSESDFHA